MERAMTIVRCVHLVLAAAAVMLWEPASAEACSCGGRPSTAAAARSAEIVFVGTVARIDRPKPAWQSRQNADGTVTVTGNASGPTFFLFDIAEVFKGPSSVQVAVVHDGHSCGGLFPFKTGETWLIYGREEVGGVTADICSRTRLVSEAEQDLLYLRNAEARPQGIVHGEVLRRRTGPSGEILQALFEPLQVLAASAANRFVTTTDQWGPFELVLPPGDYQVWVERGGKAVSAGSAVRVAHGEETKLQLVAEYPD